MWQNKSSTFTRSNIRIASWSDNTLSDVFSTSTSGPQAPTLFKSALSTHFVLHVFFWKVAEESESPLQWQRHKKPTLFTLHSSPPPCCSYRLF